MATCMRVSRPLPFQCVLEGQRVYDGGEHTGVVGGGAVHTMGGGFGSAPDVSPADDYGHLYIP